jgi:uncharacterized protein YktA (UPF0223 family)
MDYSYPILHDWTTEEIINVAAFYDAVEKAYESGVAREVLMVAYRKFKEVVPSMAEEKTLFKEFEDASGYSSYRVVKAAKEGKDGETIKGAVR